MKKLYLTFADLTCLTGFAVPGNQKFFIPAVRFLAAFLGGFWKF